MDSRFNCALFPVRSLPSFYLAVPPPVVYLQRISAVKAVYASEPERIWPDNFPRRPSGTDVMGEESLGWKL